MKISKNKIIIVLTAIVFVLSIVIIKDYQSESSSIVKYGNMEKRETISGETIRFKLNSIGVLDTAEYVYSRQEKYYSDRTIHKFPVPFTESGYTIGYDGKITAGIDFSKIFINKNGDTIHIDLPKATIHSSEVDEDSFKLYEEKLNIFNPLSVRNFNDAYADIKKSEEENAIKNGILDRANENAEKYIENLLKSAYSLEDYKFEFKTISEPQTDPNDNMTEVQPTSVNKEAS